MVGLLQIIIMMGCIYLVLKAIAITQAGLAVPEANQRRAKFYTIAGTIIGLGGAAFCLWLLMDQSASLQTLDSSSYPY